MTTLDTYKQAHVDKATNRWNEAVKNTRHQFHEERQLEHIAGMKRMLERLGDKSFWDAEEVASAERHNDDGRFTDLTDAITALGHPS